MSIVQSSLVFSNTQLMSLAWFTLLAHCKEFLMWSNKCHLMSVQMMLFPLLQECFPHKIYAAYLIKPEKFWEKQKTSIGSAKYKFEVGDITNSHSADDSMCT